MKKVVAYSLLIIVMFAFNYKAISYLLDSSKGSVAFVIDCEEEKSESEKSDEKEEKKEISEYLFHKKVTSFIVIHKPSHVSLHKFLFIPSDHSQSVYMPPELAII